MDENPAFTVHATAHAFRAATNLNSMLLPGPALNRFDRFLLIGPGAKGGPALRLLTNANLHFLSKLLVYSAGAGPSLSYFILRDQNDYQIFPTVSQNTVYKLALIPPSKYKTLIHKHLGI